MLYEVITPYAGGLNQYVTFSINTYSYECSVGCIDGPDTLINSNTKSSYNFV